MNGRRKALKLLLGGITTCLSAPLFAATDIDVYHSPD